MSNLMMPSLIKSNYSSLRFAMILLLAAGSVPAMAQQFSNASRSQSRYTTKNDYPAKSCADLQNFKTADLVELHVTASKMSDAAPLFCDVTGVLSPEIAFEVALPLNWNGRFYMIGNGGHAGDALDSSRQVAERDGALRNGFAFAQTNTGHYAAEEPGATFVMSNPQKAIDYAYRAVHLTAQTAKELIEDYYGKPAMKSYWNSCSNGGRQGLMEAQRYPGDFDGVLANAPWADQTGFTIGALWNQRALDAGPLTAEKVTLLADAVMAKCDAVDGLEDGLIDDPRNCTFDPTKDVKACEAGQDNADCLTKAQAEAAAKIYSGPVTSNGKQIFPGFMLGSEHNWMNLVVPRNANAKAADFNLAENTMRYLVFTPPNPEWDYTTFNFDTDTGELDAWSAKADAKDPDLEDFESRGGKLIMTYGWADPILQPMMGVNYYEAVVKNNDDAMDFARLFMVPGMSHCGGGIATATFDSMSALIDWVERDQAPDQIRASRVVDGKVDRTRPLCAYPKVAKYSGEGSMDDAANFSCVAP